MPRKAAVKKPATVKAKKTVKKTVKKSTAKHQVKKITVAIPVPESPPLTPLTHGHTLHYSDMHFKTNQESGHRKKQRLIIGLGVSIIMTAIVIAWILNLKKLIGPEVDAAAQAPTTDYSELTKLKDELSKTLSDVKVQLNELQNIDQEPATATITPETEEELRNAFKATVEKTITEPPTSTTPPSNLP